MHLLMKKIDIISFFAAISMFSLEIRLLLRGVYLGVAIHCLNRNNKI